MASLAAASPGDEPGHRGVEDALIRAGELDAVAALLGYDKVDSGDFLRCLRAVIRQMHDGRAGRGVVLRELASESYVNKRHLATKLVGWTAHAERMVLARTLGARGPLPYDEIRSIRLRVGGRQEKRIGTDTSFGSGRSLRFLALTAVQDGGCLPRRVIEFNTDTRWDRTSRSGQLDLIAAGEARARGPLAGSVAEHLALLLEHDAEMRRTAVARAEAEGLPEMAGHLRTLGERILLIDGLPSGPPTERWHSSAFVRFPGRETAAWTAVRAAGRRSVLACGAPTEHEQAAIGAGESVALPSRALPGATELGIRPLADVVHRWLPEHGVIVRSIRGGGRDDRAAFRPVCFADEDLPLAVAFVERMQQTNDVALALEQWEQTCAPGLSTVQSPTTAAGLYALLDAAWAAQVR